MRITVKADGAEQQTQAFEFVASKSETGDLMFVEVAGGLISGSLALLADAGHMLTDTAALAFASRNKSSAAWTSATVIAVRPCAVARICAGVSNCTAYRKLAR